MLRVFHRKPDVYIPNRDGTPYLLRWWIIPRNRFFNIYLHKFLGSDDDRALHDHPWASCSIILKGGYLEHIPKNRKTYGKRYTISGLNHYHEPTNFVFIDNNTITKKRRPGRVYFRRPSQAHRIELYPAAFWTHASGGKSPIGNTPRVAWSLFITGPKVREWGFWCKQGWVHWRKFTGTEEGKDFNPATSSNKGCGE